MGLGKGAKAVGVNACLQPEYGILESGAEMMPLTYSREVLVVRVVEAQASYFPNTEIYDKVSSNGSISSKFQKPSSFSSPLEKAPF